MSSEQEPPRKKVKQTPGSSRVLRSQDPVQDESQAFSRPQKPTTPKHKNQTSQNRGLMSDSRRRSSRKNRNAELKDNEQNIADLASPRTTTTSRKQSTQSGSSIPSQGRKGVIDRDEDSELDDDLEMTEEGEDMNKDDEQNDFRSSSARESHFDNISLAAMANLLSTNQSANLKSLLGALRQPDPSIQLIALNDLVNLLSMSTEESLAGFSQIDALIVELVNVMRGPNAFGEDNPEMMLLACRCLANLMEAMPAATANIAYSAAVPVLCQKLLEIEFIDLAEQSLSTLEKISKGYPTTVVREGGMAACLTYLDFFSTNVQRIAVTTAANSAKNIPADCFAMVRDITPTLQNIIAGSDAKVVEAGCLCLTRILESFRNNDSRLEQLLLPDLLSPVLSVISTVQASGLGVPEYIKTRLIHILALAARGSQRFAVRLLQEDVIAIVYQLLTGLSKPSSSEEIKANSVVVLQALINRPRDQVTGVIALLSEILPGLPEIELFAGLSQKDRGSNDTRSSSFHQECQAQFEEFVTIVLPTLMDMFNSTVNLSLRRLSLTALLKLCYNLDTQMLIRVVNDVPLAVFITGVLGTADTELVLAGVRLAYILLDRVQDVYSKKLRVEGCVAEIQQLTTKFGSLPDGISYETPSGTQAQAIESGSISAGHLQNNNRIINQKHYDQAGKELEDGEEQEEHEDNEDDDEEREDDDDDDVEDDLDDDDDDDDDDDEEEDYDVEDEDKGIEEADRAMTIDDEDYCGQMRDESSNSLTASIRPQMRDNQVTTLITMWAHKFEAKYSSLGIINDPQKELRHRFEQLAEQLRSDDPLSAIDELATIFSSTSEISSYSLQSTGILASLLKAMTRQDSIMNRTRFLKAFMDASTPARLVTNLQELLTWSEKFEIISTSSNEEKRSPNILAKQIRLRLVAEDDTDIPKPYRKLMVSIHAIATFKALDDYLRPRLQASSLVGSSRPSRSSTPTARGIAGTILSRAPEGLQGVLSQLASAGTSLPDSLRERIANLDTTALSDSEDRTNPAKSSQEQSVVDADMSAARTEEDTDPAVSVELPASGGGKAIARTSDGHRIPTPRTSTPTQSPVKRESKGNTSTTSGQETPRSGMSYAAALTAAPKDWHIQFEIDGKILTHDTTIFGAVNAAHAVGDASIHGNTGAALYEIVFRKVAGPAPLPVVSQPDSILATQLPRSLESESQAALMFQLLEILYSLNTNWRDLCPDANFRPLPSSAFVNTKLTAKLNRQLEEPLIVASQCLPAWAQDLPRCFPFLFPFETRYLFLQSTSFGYSRSMARWQAAAKKDREDSRSFLGRLQRQKVRISRPRMLESAMKVMELYGASPSILEVEYFDEVGTGLGPTLEFYSTVSKEVARKKFQLWRDGETASDAEYVYAAAGLFPQPISSIAIASSAAISKKSVLLFKTLGTFLARAMLDSRLVDISFSPLFFRILDGRHEVPRTVGSISEIDEGLAKSLRVVEKFSIAYQRLLDPNNSSVSAVELQHFANTITVDDATLADLGLDFTYPGRPDLDLVPGGAQIDVTIENVSEYLERVIDLTLGSGIAEQCAAFKDGFSQVFPYSALRAFSPSELTMLFGRATEDWSRENLLESIKADHGFTMDSRTVQNLVTVLSEMSDLDRRDFLQFITGSPKLPIGGFKSLTPQLTVVCKPHEAPLTANDYLPSVMTCVNYLKLPDYSDANILSARLLTAMREGGGSFHLS